MNNKKEFLIKISAIVSVDNEEVLNDLVIGKVVTCDVGIETILPSDVDFKILQYTNNIDDEWLESELLLGDE